MSAHAYMQMAYVPGENGPIGVQVMHSNRAPIRGFKFSRSAKMLLNKIHASQTDGKICAIQPGDLVNILPRELYQIACHTGASFVKPLEDTLEGHRAAARVAAELKLGDSPVEPMQSFSDAMQTIIAAAKQKASQPKQGHPATRIATASQPAKQPAKQPANELQPKPTTAKQPTACLVGKAKKQKVPLKSPALDKPSCILDSADQLPPLIELNAYEHSILCAAAILGMLQKSNVDYESDSEYEPRRDHWLDK